MFPRLSYLLENYDLVLLEEARRQAKAKGRNKTHLKDFPMGKNVTFENRCLCCFLGPSVSYLLCKITVETSIIEQVIPYPPVEVITLSRQAQIKSEIIQNLNSECSNENVTGLQE